MHRWAYCTGGNIAQVAIVHRLPYCTGGHIAQVAELMGMAADDVQTVIVMGIPSTIVEARVCTHHAHART